MGSKKLVLSNQGRIIIRMTLIVITGILMIISFIMLLSSLGIFRPKKYQVLYSYNITNNVDYKVHLVDNDFIDSEYLGPGDTYIASLIDNIEINFSQVLSGSKVKDFEFDYDISAKVEGLYSDGNNGQKISVWSKEYPLVEKKNISSKGTNTSSINDSINISYSMYNNEVQKFKKDLKLPIDAYLYVVMNIYDRSEEYVVGTTTYKISIPLDEQAFKITSDYVPTINDTERVLVDSQRDISYSNVVVYAIIFIVSTSIFIQSFFILWHKVKTNDYLRVLKKILRDYDQIIVEVDADVDVNNYEIVRLKSFKELLDLEEELRMPILHFEKNESVSYFSIINQNILYRYYFTEQEVIMNKYKS